jgi:ABC-type dipeptide/oligopeptide/nickel transport system permease component
LSIVGYLVRRILILPLILLGLYTIVFFMAHVVPADPARAMAGEGATEETVARIAAEFGLDKSLTEQYVLGISRSLRGDFGRSIHTWRPVVQDLKDFFPATVELATVSMILAVVLGCTLGALSAIYRGSIIDILSTGFSVFWISMPHFWLGMLLQIVLCVLLNNFLPLGGRVSIAANLQRITGFNLLDSLLTGNLAALVSSMKHMILPAFTLGITSLGLFSRMTRTGLLNTLKEDYVRTIRAFGHPSRVVVWRAFRNVLIPVVTITGMQFGFLLGGTVAVETVFDWPGLGLYAAQSALTADYPSIIALTLLFGLIRMIFNLLTDISYFLLDPRIRY